MKVKPLFVRCLGASSGHHGSISQYYSYLHNCHNYIDFNRFIACLIILYCFKFTHIYTTFLYTSRKKHGSNHGMATFRKKNNKWEAAIFMKGVRRSKTFHTKTQAAHWAAETEKEIISGKTGNHTDKTFADLIKKYANEVSPTKKGEKWEVTRLNAILRQDISKLMLSHISRQDIAVWRDLRLEKVSPSSVKREMNLISHVFNVGINDWGWMTENPVKGVRRPRESPSRDRIISENELQRLMFALGYEYDGKLDTVSSRVAAALLFAIETAMRAGEIAKLKWSDIQKRTAILYDTKNGTKREVPLSAEAIRIIDQAKNESEYVFNISTSQIDSLFRKAKKMTLIKDLHFHDSRHTAITRLAKKLNVLELARMVGHKDLRQLQIYYNESADELAKKLD